MVIAQLTTDNRENFRQYDKPEPYFGTAPEALLQGFARLPGVRVHVISCTQRPMPAPEKLAENTWFHSLHVPKFGWLRTGYQGCIRAVRRKLQEIQPDIVHGHGTERDCALSAVFSGFPNVVTVHGNMRTISVINQARPFSYQWLAARLEGFTLARAGGVVCITDYTRRALAGRARRTWIVHNAVDESFFQIAWRPKEPKTILCVGDITERKNQNQFIRALDPLAVTGGFRVLFHGAWKEDAFSSEFFELLKSRPWCQYGGRVTRAELKQLLSEAALLALPSLEENCPMTVLEAMAAGVPVAAARVGGVPELIEDGRTGLLFNPVQPEGMTHAVQCLLVDALLAQRLAEGGRQEASARFHPDAIARRHVEIYQEVLKTAKTSRADPLLTGPQNSSRAD